MIPYLQCLNCQCSLFHVFITLCNFQVLQAAVLSFWLSIEFDSTVVPWVVTVIVLCIFSNLQGWIWRHTALVVLMSDYCSKTILLSRWTILAAFKVAYFLTRGFYPWRRRLDKHGYNWGEREKECVCVSLELGLVSHGLTFLLLHFW